MLACRNCSLAGARLVVESAKWISFVGVVDVSSVGVVGDSKSRAVRFTYSGVEGPRVPN